MKISTNKNEIREHGERSSNTPLPSPHSWPNTPWSRSECRAIGFWRGATSKSHRKWMQHKLSLHSTAWIRHENPFKRFTPPVAWTKHVLQLELYFSSNHFLLMTAVHKERPSIFTLHCDGLVQTEPRVWTLTEPVQQAAGIFKWWVTLETRNQIRPVGWSVERHLPNTCWIKSMSSASFPSHCPYSIALMQDLIAVGSSISSL